MSTWSRAAEMAARTPSSRNRYVDFLRAASILVVVLGHWLAAAPHREPDGSLTPSHVLAVADWTHWLTWVVQVMPIFFMVGGFSNAITWRAARHAGRHYAEWVSARLRRLGRGQGNEQGSGQRISHRKHGLPDRRAADP